MHKYEVEIAFADGEQVEKQTVQAGDGNKAICLVLEQFKNDSRVCDSQSWNVKVRKLPDA